MIDSAPPPARSARERARAAVAPLMLVVGAVVLIGGVAAGFVNRTVLDADSFADRADSLRRDPAVSTALGHALVDAYVQRSPDVIAVRPLLDAVGTAIAGSDLLSGPARTAARTFLRSMTQPNSSDVVLRLADAGSVVAAATQRLAPEGTVPGGGTLALELARVGGQSAAGRTLHLAASVRVAAWLLPLAGLALLAGGVLLARDRRRAAVRAGSALAAVAALAGLLLLAGGVWATSQDDTTLTGALVHHGYGVFVAPLGWSLAGVAVVGSLVAGASAGVLPSIDPVRLVARARDVVVTPPAGTVPALLRALGLLLLGIGAVLRPGLVVTLLGVLLGVWLLAAGLFELARATRRAAPDPVVHADGGRRVPLAASRRRWPAGVAAGVVLALLVAWGAVPGNSPTAIAAPSTGEGCDGSPVLCDRPFDQVAFAASHNAMSQATDRSWFIPEQGEGFAGQLDLGVRGLLIDVWPGYRTQGGRIATARSAYAEAKAQAEKDFGVETVAAGLRVFDAVTDPTPAGPERLYLCHGLCEIGAHDFVDDMTQVRDWLDTHPREVVSLIIEDYVAPERIAAALDEAGLSRLAFVPPAAGRPWPTLGELVGSGRRVLVMLENGTGGTAHPWLRQRLPCRTPGHLVLGPAGRRLLVRGESRPPGRAPVPDEPLDRGLHPARQRCARRQRGVGAGAAGADLPYRAPAAELRRGELRRHRGRRRRRALAQRAGSRRLT